MVNAGEAVEAYLPTDKTWTRDEEAAKQIKRWYDGEYFNCVIESNYENDLDPNFAD